MKLLLQARIRGCDGQSRRSALRHTARVCLRTSRLRVPVSLRVCTLSQQTFINSAGLSDPSGFSRVETFWNSLGYDRSRRPRSVPAFLPRRISVGPRFSDKVREEPQRRERKWGRKLCSQGFCDSQTQDERAYSGGCDESRTPQSTSLPAEPKRGSKNKRTTAVRATKAKRAADENNPSKLARYLSKGWGLNDLPLRAAFSPAHPLADIFTRP